MITRRLRAFCLFNVVRSSLPIRNSNEIPGPDPHACGLRSAHLHHRSPCRRQKASIVRRTTLLWSLLSVAVVVGLFVIKHRVQDLENQLHALNAEILADRDATQVLEAEWSYLNQPARLEALSRKLLGMKPPTADQTVTMEEFHLKMMLTDKNSADTLVLDQPSNSRIEPAQKSDHRIINKKLHVDRWAKPKITKIKNSE